MPLIHLKDDHIQVQTKAGTTLRQVATKSGASMEFGCRVGDCGTCVAKVIEGESYLSPLNDKERKLLAILGDGYAGCRLMCQCSVVSQEGEIVISYVCP
jgi:ferredoxin